MLFNPKKIFEDIKGLGQSLAEPVQNTMQDFDITEKAKPLMGALQKAKEVTGITFQKPRFGQPAIKLPGIAGKVQQTVSDIVASQTEEEKPSPAEMLKNILNNPAVLLGTRTIDISRTPKNISQTETGNGINNGQPKIEQENSNDDNYLKRTFHKTLGFLNSFRNLSATQTQANILDTLRKETVDFSSIPKLVPDPKKPDEWYHPNPVPKPWQDSINRAYQRTGLPKGLLEAVLMKESDMGTSSDNVAGFYESAKKHLEAKGIEVDLGTTDGQIQAMADYLKLRKTGIRDKKYGGGEYDFTDPVELYMNQYYTDKDAGKDRKVFEYYLNAYRNN